MINEGYPSPGELIKNEINTLERLKNDPHLWQSESTCKLANDANVAYYQMKEARSFDFESSFEIQVDGNPGIAFIGGNIIPTDDGNGYNQLTYHFAICNGGEGPHKPLRKLHFDYAEPRSSNRQPHPVFHCQLPGDLTPAMAKAGCNIEHLYPWLSEPRLPYRPMSLALLINLIFIEFPDENADRFIARGEWRSLIKKNEELVLEPYYEKCYEFVKKRKDGRIRSSQLITNDFFYGN